jgi:hypothetical protein
VHFGAILIAPRLHQVCTNLPDALFVQLAQRNTKPERRKAMARQKNALSVYRNSIDGRFITRAQAEKRPATTERQSITRKKRSRTK